MPCMIFEAMGQWLKLVMYDRSSIHRDQMYVCLVLVSSIAKVSLKFRIIV